MPKKNFVRGRVQGGESSSPPLKRFHKYACCLVFMGVAFGVGNLYYDELGISSLLQGISRGGRVRNATTSTAAVLTTVTATTGEKHLCGLLPAQESLEKLRTELNWIPLEDAPQIHKDYFVDVQRCASKFPRAKVEEEGFNNKTLIFTDKEVFGGGSRMPLALACSNDNNEGPDNVGFLTQGQVQEIVAQRDNILFAGDSVLYQQYFVFLCMLDHQSVTPQSMHTYSSDSPGASCRYDYHHNQADGKTTTIRFEGIGRFSAWDPKMPELWERSFPEALQTFASGDAIVMDSSRHFNTLDILEYEKVLQFIAQSRTQQQATIHYMEPTPQEWPTSNGIHLEACRWFCNCQPLTDDAISGVAIPNLTASLANNPAAATAAANPEDGRTSISRLHYYLYEPFAKLYDPQKAASFTLQANADDNGACLPDCVPATWRSDLARSILLNNNNNNNNHLTKMVPTFWQLVGRPQHSSLWMRGDCTHRSMDAIYFMNEQLIRSMQSST